MITTNHWISKVEEDAYGDLFITIPLDLREQLDWREGDTLKWTDNQDGSWSIQKVKSD
jgi:hypothetical protein